MSLRLARVAASHPEDNSVDIVFIEDGQRLPGVQVMSWAASTNTGSHDLPTPGMPGSGDKWSLSEKTDRDMIAVVGFIGRGQPVVLGFLFPQISQMLFTGERRVSRHASDWYTTVDGNGNFEAAHPSGTYFRVGTAPSHEDLTGQDVDGNWKIARNTDKAVYVHLRVSNAGVEKASIDIDPSGNITLNHVGNLAGNTGGNAVLMVSGTTSLQSGGNVDVTAPLTTIHGPVTVTGKLTVQGGMDVSGGSGATITGNLAASGGSLTHDGVNVGSTHVHDDPQGGTVGPPH